MSSQETSAISDNDEVEVQQYRSATTKVAFLDLPRTEVDYAREDRIGDLIRRGYNTIALPLMRDGRLMAFPKKKRKSIEELDGVLIRAINRCARESDPSVWVTVDPLSTTNHDGEVSNFAQEHRGWLLRNTRGNSVPIGKNSEDPLFSWLNPDYRRYLGDLMVNLAQTERFQAFVIDLRAYPIPSPDPDRWYCCSYESQKRASEDLGINFEDMLASGNRSEIHRWQRWIRKELTTLIRYLKSRVRVARYDVYWKVLVDYVNPHDPQLSPWVDWVKDGLVEEVITCFDPQEYSPASVIQQIDLATSGRNLILPAYPDENSLRDNWEELKDCITTGYSVMNPAIKSGTILPDFLSVWEFNGALEDNPYETGIALAEYLRDCLVDDEVLSRFYARLAKSLERFEPFPDQVGSLLGHVHRMEKRFEDKAYHLIPEYRNHIREMDLLLRILPTIRMIPEVY